MHYLATFLLGLLFYFSNLCTAQDHERHKIRVIGDSERYFLTGKELNLTCKIYPLVDDMNIVSWYVNGSNITLGDRFTKGMENCRPFSCFTLNVKYLEITDAGNYSCRLLEDDGMETLPELPFILDVFDPIKVAESTGSLRQKAVGGNSSVSLWCRFKGQNIHSVTWHRQSDQEILTNHKEKMVDDFHVDSMLLITNIRDKNGTYVCSASDSRVRTSHEVHLFVLDVPHLTLQTVAAIDARSVFMNWTLNDGNSKNVKYSLKYFTNSSFSWQFYNQEIKGEENSCIIINLEPNTTYWFKIQPSNDFGAGAEHVTQVTTLDSDRNFVPELHIKSTGPSSVTLAWDRLPVSVKKYVHFFKLLIFNDDIRKETLVSPSDYYQTYAFTELKSATTYNFSMATCNELTNECGNYSKVVSGTTLDGLAGPPENVTVVCKYDNISHINSILASWSPPKQTNGQIVNYYTTIVGHATYVNEDGILSNATYGPKSRSLKNYSSSVLFERLPPNTNYTIFISAVTRSRDNGQISQGHCLMPPTVPNVEDLDGFDWVRVEEQGQRLFKLKKPRLSERNGAICCFKVYVVKLKEQQTTQQLPPPESNQIHSYEYVRNVGEGAYLADIFDKDSIDQDIILGDGNYVNNTSKCSQCPVSIPKGTHRPLTAATTNASVSEDSEYEIEYYVKPYDGELDKNSNYTGFVQVIVFGQDSFISAYSRYFTILQPGPQSLEFGRFFSFWANVNFNIPQCLALMELMLMLTLIPWLYYNAKKRNRNIFPYLRGCRDLHLHRTTLMKTSKSPKLVIPLPPFAHEMR